MKKLIATAVTTIVAFASANTELSTLEAKIMEAKQYAHNEKCCNPYWFEHEDSNIITLENILTISKATVEQDSVED